MQCGQMTLCENYDLSKILKIINFWPCYEAIECDNWISVAVNTSVGSYVRYKTVTMTRIKLETIEQYNAYTRIDRFTPYINPSMTEEDWNSVKYWPNTRLFSLHFQGTKLHNSLSTEIQNASNISVFTSKPKSSF